MQIAILKGIYSDEAGDYRTKYPRNLIPIPKTQGISTGYLRASYGIETFSEGPGVDRGAINWNGVCYRVMGDQLVSVAEDGEITQHGSVGEGGQVKMDYSFDLLAIASGGKMFLFDGSVVKEVIDGDLDPEDRGILNVLWLDGYFVFLDGENIGVTELTDPFAVNPLKYGSSEIDPDPIVAILKQRNEVVALNRYTIEYFDNVGGAANQFPFTRIDGAQVQRGCVGPDAATVFNEMVAFVGSGRNEATSVWLGGNGQTVKLSDREVDQTLKQYTEDEVAAIILESRLEEGHESLYMHLPDQTLVYDVRASQAMGTPVWHSEDSGLIEPERYQAFNFVRAYNKWICGDPTSFRLGVLTDKVSSHHGETIGWDLNTAILFNEAKSYTVHALELTGLTGRVDTDKDPVVYARFSDDQGATWSQDKPKPAGRIGDRRRKIEWRRQGRAERVRIQSIRGTSDAHIGIARLDLTIEGHAV